MKTKELHRYRKVSIGIFDEDNWYVADICTNDKTGEEYQNNYKYYSRLDNLVERTADRLTMREAESFSDFIERYQTIAQELRGLIVGHEESQTPRKRPKGRAQRESALNGLVREE